MKTIYYVIGSIVAAALVVSCIALGTVLRYDKLELWIGGVEMVTEWPVKS